jgi:hypothetical protein
MYEVDGGATRRAHQGHAASRSTPHSRPPRRAVPINETRGERKGRETESRRAETKYGMMHIYSFYHDTYYLAKLKL